MSTSQLRSPPDAHGVPSDAIDGVSCSRPPPPRQCGRCRLFFCGDPTLEPSSQAAWWLCAPCRSTLLGTGPPRLLTPDDRDLTAVT
jgi:hypothetical protein